VKILGPAATLLWILLLESATPLCAQDLAPRAYLITPVHANAVTITWSWHDGGVNFNGVVPVTNASGAFSVPSLVYTHSFSFFGHSANVNAALPYLVGTFSGEVASQQHSVYRSGLADLGLRLSVNLNGGPAMTPQEYMKWKQKVILGVSLKVVAPTGQYDPEKLINPGINRWAFKPEFGYSQRFGKWILDGYAGVWFYTTNNRFFDIPAPAPQSEAPIGSFEGHLSYNFPKPRRMWASLDGNLWLGGEATLNGVPQPDTKQLASRLGGTLAVPIAEHQTLKFSYSGGTYIRFGGSWQEVAVAWQYAWLGRPR
jgi:hypothetical protein